MKKNIYKFLQAAFFISFVFYLLGVQVIFAQVNQNVDAQISLAMSYEQAGQFSKAEEIYRKILKEQPWNNQLYDPLNRVLVSQKKYNESIDLLKNRISQTPNDFTLYGLLGLTLYMTEDFKSAEEMWEKGIAVSPTSYVPYRLMANYAIECRAFDKAVELLNRAKAFAPDPTMFSMDLANIHIVNMQFEKAAVEFCNMIDMHPDQLMVVKFRIGSYINKPSALKETIDVVKNFLQSKRKLEFYDLMTFIYQTSDNYEDAFKNVIETEENQNSNGMYLFSFAQESLQNRKYEWASEAFNRIIKNYSGSPYFQIAQIGYVKTLEAALEQKYFKQNESWKPISIPSAIFTTEYKDLIYSYEGLINGFTDKNINLDVLFRIAQICCNRIFDFPKAVNYYKKIIETGPQTNYALQSLIALGNISIFENKLEEAKRFYHSTLSSAAVQQNDVTKTNFLLARIEFWLGNYSGAMNLLKNVIQNPMNDYSNDALELSALVSSTKKDSVNLLKYAKADLLLLQNKYKEAATELKTLSDDNNLFIINDFAKIKIAELQIAQSNYTEAIKILEDVISNKKSFIFLEKSIFLQAECYRFGLNDLVKAVEIYQKLLETFPNSLYFDRAREALISIQTQNEKK